MSIVLLYYMYGSVLYTIYGKEGWVRGYMHVLCIAFCTPMSKLICMSECLLLHAAVCGLEISHHALFFSQPAMERENRCLPMCPTLLDSYHQ